MLTYAIVPVKSLLKSKTRLSPLLTSQERGSLTLAMLQRILDALSSSKVYRTVVISSNVAFHKFVKAFNASYLEETRQGLNNSVNQAIKWCIQNGAESVLILPADVPLVTPKDINQIINLGLSKSVVISPSKDGGTNALLQTPPGIISPCFGADSFRRHIHQASIKHASVKVYQSSRMALDIDYKEDLKRFLRTTRSNFIDLDELTRGEFDSSYLIKEGELHFKEQENNHSTYNFKANVVKLM